MCVGLEAVELHCAPDGEAFTDKDLIREQAFTDRDLIRVRKVGWRNTSNLASVEF